RPRNYWVAALPAALAGNRENLGGCSRAAASVARARLSNGGAVRYGFVWHRVSGSVAARALALPDFRYLSDHRRVDPVLEQHLLGDFLSRGGTDRRPNRTDQHNGVHSPTLEHSINPNPVRTRSCDRNCLVAGPQRAVADGCADTQLLCDGGGRARG